MLDHRKRRFDAGTAVMLSWVLFAVVGCPFSSPPGEGDPVGPGGDKDETVPVPVQRAYFMLQRATVYSEEWPDRFLDHRIFVCNPALAPQTVAKIREDLPGVLCLAYTNAQDAFIGMYPDDAYYLALTAAFDSSLCIRDLVTGNVVRIYQSDPEDPSTAVPTFILRQESADVLVDFHRDVTMDAAWDGFYIDMCTAVFPDYRIRRLSNITDSYDIDGDGSPDSEVDIQTQYATWRPYFTARLRETLGEEMIVLGNSGGALDDPSLNGITLEGVGIRFTPAEARAALASQRAVGQDPFQAVLWVTGAESHAPTLDLAESLDGVFYGELNYVVLD